MGTGAGAWSQPYCRRTCLPNEADVGRVEKGTGRMWYGAGGRVERSAGTEAETGTRRS